MPIGEEEIISYVTPLNTLSRKLSTAVENGEHWSIEQEQPGSDCLLALLKIKSGEKIVIDFENDDGWTWRDEHSGPFSWMTRSQQDLTDLDDPIAVSQVISSNKTTRSEHIPKKRLSQQFSSPLGEEAPGGLSEIEAAFQKFGLTQTESGTTTVTLDDITSHDRQDTLLYDLNSHDDNDIVFNDISSSEQTVTVSDDFSVTVSDDFLPSDNTDTMSPKTEHTAFVAVDNDVCSSVDVTPVHKPYPTDKYRGVNEAEDESLMADQESVDTHTYTDTGHLSPAFEFDPVDSFSRDTHVTVAPIEDINEGESTSQTDSKLNIDGVTTDDSCYDNLASVNDSYEHEEKQKNGEKVDNVDQVVTGFDFLDNW